MKNISDIRADLLAVSFSCAAVVMSKVQVSLPLSADPVKALEQQTQQFNKMLYEVAKDFYFGIVGAFNDHQATDWPDVQLDPAQVAGVPAGGNLASTLSALVPVLTAAGTQASPVLAAVQQLLAGLGAGQQPAAPPATPQPLLPH
jgi:hypothetical protein